MLIAAEVIALRLPLIAGEAAMLPGALNKPGRPESERMVSEKVAALGEGMVEASFKAGQIGLEWGMAAFFGDTFRMARLSNAAPKRLAHAFTGPGRKRMTANAKRLRRTK